MTLIDFSILWVLNNQTVSSVIVGPRTIEHWHEPTWAKLILNIASGPSTVLSQLPLCDVVTAPGMTTKIRSMLNEAIVIAAAAGFTTKRDIEKVVEKFSAGRHRPSIL